MSIGSGDIVETVEDIINAVQEVMGLEDRFNATTEKEKEQIIYELHCEYRKEKKLRREGITRNEWDESGLPDDLCCEVCGFENEIIESRCRGYDELLLSHDDDLKKDAKWICISCDCYDNNGTDHDSNNIIKIPDRCVGCGLCNILEESITSGGGNFYPYSNGPNCMECIDRIESSNPLSNPDDLDDSDNVSDISLTDSEDNIYESEYEINNEIIENNTEKVLGIKQNVKIMGEIMFDIKDEISEGRYLEMMNLLMKITKQLNYL